MGSVRRWMQARTQRRSGPVGPYRVVVVGVDDPQGLGRVRVQYPAVFGPDPGLSAWAPVLTPHAGPAEGFVAVPAVGAEVMVMFEGGDVGRPIVIGGLWSAAQPPPPLPPSTRAWHMASGAELRFADEGQVVELHHPGGSSVALLEDGSVRISSGTAVEIVAPTVRCTAAAVDMSGTLTAAMVIASQGVIAPNVTPP